MSTSYRYSPLHVHFHHKNHRAFRQVLEASKAAAIEGAGGLSTSGGRSWQNSFGQSQLHQYLGNASTSDIVNGRDPNGRTVLHHVCSSVDPVYQPFLQSLLSHPLLNVNVQDDESGWTPLHCALWVGNISTAVALVKRKDINVGLKDREGYTAFDLYNSTVEGTAPSFTASDADAGRELYTWSAPRGAPVGMRDEGEKMQPQRLDIERPISEPGTAPDVERFNPVRFKDIAMARLHSIVVTDEKYGNLRASGQGSGGRLGTSAANYAQNNFISVPHISNLTVVSVATGQDHTLILTDGGEIYSWGLNRFNQLGYASDSVKNAAGQDESMQVLPRRITGELGRLKVKGVTACKIASACWTERDVFTWGTNRGQLGYSKISQPVQLLPRKVTPITAPIISAAIADSALCVLLVTREVICFAHDTHFRVNFPLNPFPPHIKPSYSPSVVAKSRYRRVEKIICCEDNFALISEAGDVFVWNVPSPEATGGGYSSSASTKPQRIWTSSRQWNSAKDVALGADGAAIICTESGHAYLRSKQTGSSIRTGSGAKYGTSGFQRVPSINRVVKVALSPVGTFAAMTTDARPGEIHFVRNTLSEDLSELLPFTRKPPTIARSSSGPTLEDEAWSAGDDIADHVTIMKDASIIKNMCAFIAEQPSPPSQPYVLPAMIQRAVDRGSRSCGGDMVVCTEAMEITVHSALLVSRCGVVGQILFEGRIVKAASVEILFETRSTGGAGRLRFNNCHPLTVLLLLQYIYTDDVAALWDRRINDMTEGVVEALKTHSMFIKAQLLAVSKTLSLPKLAKTMEGIMKITPMPSLRQDMTALFENGCLGPSRPGIGGHDVILELADRAARCHSAVLRVRSEFFASLFDDPDWTSMRWNEDGVVTIKMRHLDWKVMEHIFLYMYCARREDMFENIPALRTAEDLLEHVFAVLTAANELLITDLMTICSRVVIRHITIHNVCALLRDATLLKVNNLVASLQHYICVNLEVMLQTGVLEDLSDDALKDLTNAVRAEQSSKLPFTRSDAPSKALSTSISNWADWLSTTDIPPPFYQRSHKQSKTSPRLEPIEGTSSHALRRKSSVPEQIPSPLTMAPMQSPGEDVDLPLDLSIGAPDITSKGPPSPLVASVPWKGKGIVKSAEKQDFRTIMESERLYASTSPPLSRSPRVQHASSTSPDVPKWTPKRSHSDLRQPMQSAPPSPGPRSSSTPGGSPWKVVPRPTTSVEDITAEALNAAPESPTKKPQGKQAPSGLSRAMSAHSKAIPSDSKVSSSDTQLAGMGPVIQPIRMSSYGGISVTNKKSGDAWGQPKQPPPNGSNASKTPKEIVQEAPRQSKKSLREIQEEEESAQIEADFERWWAQEESRVKAEEEALIAAAKAASNPSGGRHPRGRNSKKSGKGGVKPSGGGKPSTKGTAAIPIKRSPSAAAGSGHP